MNAGARPALGRAPWPSPPWPAWLPRLLISRKVGHKTWAICLPSAYQGSSHLLQAQKGGRTCEMVRGPRSKSRPQEGKEKLIRAWEGAQAAHPLQGFVGVVGGGHHPTLHLPPCPLWAMATRSSAEEAGLAWGAQLQELLLASSPPQTSHEPTFTVPTAECACGEEGQRPGIWVAPLPAPSRMAAPSRVSV